MPFSFRKLLLIYGNSLFMSKSLARISVYPNTETTSHTPIAITTTITNNNPLSSSPILCDYGYVILFSVVTKEDN